MTITSDEQAAIRAVLAYGASYGYGNLISHLQTAWAKTLIDHHGMTESVARASTGGLGYPFQMQRDLVEYGLWDETGKRYRANDSASSCSDILSERG